MTFNYEYIYMNFKLWFNTTIFLYNVLSIYRLFNHSYFQHEIPIILLMNATQTQTN